MSHQHEAEQRFLTRVARRLKFIESLRQCGLVVYLPADKDQRLSAAEKLARLTAHASEFPHLSDARIKDAAAALLEAMNQGQRLLPYDVQHENRIRREW